MAVTLRQRPGESFTVGHKTFVTPIITIPGLVASAAYASGDALGVKFQIPLPTSGVIEVLNVIDLDKEQLALDLLLFTGDIDGGVDNAAFDMTDFDQRMFIGAITCEAADFKAMNDNAVGTVSNGGVLPLRYVAPLGYLVCQAVTRGAPNLTGATDYAIRLTVRPD